MSQVKNEQTAIFNPWHVGDRHIIALALGYLSAMRSNSDLEKKLSESTKMESYFIDELGYVPNSDGSQMLIRELESHVPLARRYMLDFPQGSYQIVAGNYLGGKFVPANLEAHSRSTHRFKMKTNMTIHVFQNPSGEPQFHVDAIDFNSSQRGGGFLKHEIDINQLNYKDNPGRQAITWRIGNDKPHGELQTYSATTSFIPLFILREGVKLKDSDGTDKPCEGLAIWIEIPRNKKVVSPN